MPRWKSSMERRGGARGGAVVAGALMALLGGAVGCGPILSTQTLSDAEAAIEAAREAGADQSAVYEYVSAVEYWEKAREEWAYSDFQHALEYAERAVEFAQRAFERAQRSPRRAAPVFEGLIDEDL